MRTCTQESLYDVVRRSHWGWNVVGTYGQCLVGIAVCEDLEIRGASQNAGEVGQVFWYRIINANVQSARAGAQPSPTLAIFAPLETGSDDIELTSRSETYMLTDEFRNHGIPVLADQQQRRLRIDVPFVVQIGLANWREGVYSVSQKQFRNSDDLDEDVSPYLHGYVWQRCHRHLSALEVNSAGCTPLSGCHVQHAPAKSRRTGVPDMRACSMATLGKIHEAFSEKPWKTDLQSLCSQWSLSELDPQPVPIGRKECLDQRLLPNTETGPVITSAAVSFATFDGVHKGSRRLASCSVATTKSRDSGADDVLHNSLWCRTSKT